MAGFDYQFTFCDAERPYVEACLRASRTRAHHLSCRWRTSRADSNRILCTVDGQTRRLDLLGAVLTSDLQHVCEGVDGALPPRRAAALGRGFADLFLRGRDLGSEGRILKLREVADTSLYYPVYQFTNDGGTSANLRARLRITEDVVTGFGLERVERVVVMEELHTALEQTMRELLRDAGRKTNWPTLVKMATAAGYLDMDRLFYGTAHRHTTDDLLLATGINKRRNAAKHREGDPNDLWISEHWECLAMLVEHLVDHLPARDEQARLGT